MDIIMDEKKEAEIVIKNNEINMNKPSQTIQLLIKYYYNVKHMNKEDIRKEIEKYMQNNYKGFNSTRWQKSLDDMVQRWAKDKYKLTNIHRIAITTGLKANLTLKNILKVLNRDILKIIQIQ